MILEGDVGTIFELLRWELGGIRKGKAIYKD